MNKEALRENVSCVQTEALVLDQVTADEHNHLKRQVHGQRPRVDHFLSSISFTRLSCVTRGFDITMLAEFLYFPVNSKSF
jgi:hypothetical protein